MSDLKFHLFRPTAVPEMSRQISVARRLLEDGTIAPWQLFFAKRKQAEWDTSLTEVLLSQGWVREIDVLNAQSAHFGAQIVDLASAPPDPRLQSFLDPEFCLKHAIIPWIKINGLILYATSRPELFAQIQPLLPGGRLGTLMALAQKSEIEAFVAKTHKAKLTQSAETRVPDVESCRTFRANQSVLYAAFACVAAAILCALWALPILTLSVILILSMTTQVAALMLKVLAFLASLKRKGPQAAAPPDHRLPKFSVLVPLFREKEIASALVRRLSVLTYPKALLEVVLVLEETDEVTQCTVSNTLLPKWMRVVTVPEGSGLKTKPRAMNYALDFCRGDIVGIWDAEDAPAPDQLEVIAAQFARSPPKVVCLQGMLDYYNPYTNWISRCFTIEYAIWFRTILPGLVTLKAPIPLGGTTLFFKRDALEKIGRWDAHNVTEDADLGIRLARYGYRADIAPTVTQEEANCAIRPWIRQRSRWIKGYLLTYLVHMRRPSQTLKDLGVLGFTLFNILFLTAVFLFFLKPVAWLVGALLTADGIFQPTPFTQFLLVAAPTIFGLSICFDLMAAQKSLQNQSGRQRLLIWVMCLPMYFPLASIAAYKAIWESVTCPFFWDKTEHGKTDEGENANYSALGI